MMKIFEKHILPAALVAGFLFYFFSDAFYRHFSLDDYMYDGIVRKFGIWESIKMLYSFANGRWFSHIVSALSFGFFGQSFFLYGIYITFLLFLFIWAVRNLYKNYCTLFFKQAPSLLHQLCFSLVFTATLYFLLFEGRWETWGWASAVNTHLLSVILCLFLFSLLLTEKQGTLALTLICLFSAFIGGLNEVNAICSILAIFYLLFLTKFHFAAIRLNKLSVLLSILFIGASLLVNIFSGGYKLRVDGLPEFTLLQSLKNTAHSFLMPLFHYKFLPLFGGALITFFLFIKNGSVKFSRDLLMPLSGILIIVGISFFLHCFTLSDVVPARGALWGYCFLLFSLFSFASK